MLGVPAGTRYDEDYNNFVIAGEGGNSILGYAHI